MKQTELRPCDICGRPLGEAGPIFYRFVIDVMVIDIQAARRQVGLEMMIGSPEIAYHMGEQADLAKPVGEGETILVCQDPDHFTDTGRLMQAATDRQNARDRSDTAEGA